MKRGEVILLSQLLRTAEELAMRMEEAYLKKDAERFESLRKELVAIHINIDRLV